MTKHYKTNEKKKKRNVAHIYISKILKIIYIKEHYFKKSQCFCLVCYLALPPLPLFFLLSQYWVVKPTIVKQLVFQEFQPSQHDYFSDKWDFLFKQSRLHLVVWVWWPAATRLRTFDAKKKSMLASYFLEWSLVGQWCSEGVPRLLHHTQPLTVRKAPAGLDLTGKEFSRVFYILPDRREDDVLWGVHACGQ